MAPQNPGKRTVALKRDTAYYECKLSYLSLKLAIKQVLTFCRWMFLPSNCKNHKTCAEQGAVCVFVSVPFAVLLPQGRSHQVRGGQRCQPGRGKKRGCHLGAAAGKGRRQPLEYLLWACPLDLKNSPVPSAQVSKSTNLPRKLSGTGNKNLDFLADKRKNGKGVTSRHT